MSRDTSPPRIWVRLTLVLGVLAGLFAMHGLAPAHADSSVMAGLAAGNDTGASADRVIAPSSGAGEGSPPHPGAELSDAMAAGHTDHVMASCLLALTAALVLALVLPGLRQLVVGRCDWPPVPRPEAPRPSPRPARRAPDLFDLCALRL